MHQVDAGAVHHHAARALGQAAGDEIIAVVRVLEEHRLHLVQAQAVEQAGGGAGEALGDGVAAEGVAQAGDERAAPRDQRDAGGDQTVDHRLDGVGDELVRADVRAQADQRHDGLEIGARIVAGARERVAPHARAEEREPALELVADVRRRDHHLMALGDHRRQQLAAEIEQRLAMAGEDQDPHRAPRCQRCRQAWSMRMAQSG